MIDPINTPNKGHMTSFITTFLKPDSNIAHLCNGNGEERHINTNFPKIVTFIIAHLSIDNGEKSYINMKIPKK